MSGDGRKWLFVILAAMGLTFAALTFFLFGEHPPEVQAASPTQEPAPATPAVPRLLVPLSPIAADETVLCGYGRVKQSALDDIRAEARTAADSTFSRLQEKLAASRDARESALGLYLQRSIGSTEELAKLALGSRDPQVYALAFRSGFVGYGASCTLLSADRWAEIEPENGVPWLLVANAAHWRRDGVTRDLAVYRASNAKFFDAHFPNFPALLQLPDIRKQAPQTRSVLAEDLLAMRLIQTELSYSAFFRFCNIPSVADPSHINTCSDLTKLLVEHDRTMMGLSVAVKLAQSANWPPDVVNTLRERRTAYEAALTAAVPQGGGRPKSDCEQVAELEHWAADYARLGDRQVAMKFIETVSARDR